MGNGTAVELQKRDTDHYRCLVDFHDPIPVRKSGTPGALHNFFDDLQVKRECLRVIAGSSGLIVLTA
jgi:hypothetical protein